jgi:lysophospholipase L1-like esterase
MHSTITRSTTRLVTMVVLASAWSPYAAVAADHPTSQNRVSVWSPSMTMGGATFHDQTLRMVAHMSTSGSSLRIHLSNLRSSTPLVVGRISIATQADGASAVPGSLRAVTVADATALTLAAGAEAVSDPIPMQVKAGQNVLISLYLPQQTSASTWHSDAFDTTYMSNSGTGNRTQDIDAGNFAKTGSSWYYLSGVDVLSDASETVVAFGDSITDGYNTPKGAYARWPDYLARRLADDHHPTAVVDAGIGGNRVLTDAPNVQQGISAIKRFSHDALEQPGVRTVILVEGINDIGNHAGLNGSPLTAQNLIDGYRTLIKQAHDAGIRIIGGTMLPDKNADYYTESGEAIRLACNQWIRTSGAFDGVVDFDRALRDPDQPASMRAEYDSGDHLHPNAAGMQAMANAVNLQLLTSSVKN